MAGEWPTGMAKTSSRHAKAASEERDAAFDAGTEITEITGSSRPTSTR